MESESNRTTSAAASNSDSSQKGLRTLMIYMTLTIILVCFLNFYPPAKLFFFEFGEKLDDLGWYGPYLMVLFNGFIVIPFALPYGLFELCIALMIPSYWFALTLGVLSRLLGCVNCYLITKKFLKERIREMLDRQKAYKSIEKLLEQRTFHFLMVFRTIYVPYFLKNYGLSLPDVVKFPSYIITALIGAVMYSSAQVYIFQQASNITQSISSDDKDQIIFVVVMIGISIFLVMHIMKYTKKIMKQLDEPMMEENREMSNMSGVSNGKNKEIEIVL